MKRRTITSMAAVALAGLVVAGCANPVVPVHPIPVPEVDVRPAGAEVLPGPYTPPQPETCRPDRLASLRPTGSLPSPGSAAALAVLPAAARRGKLIVGVSQDTLNWADRNPTSDKLTGFDVDMLKQIALAMFGSDDSSHIQFLVVPNADRAQAVATGKVDIVAETMTITCSREHDTKVNGKKAYPVDFSSVYYDAKQLLLVPRASGISSVADLAGKRVCASKGSTSIQKLATLPVTPKVIPWQVTNQTDCLVMLQQGQVDAISTDDTILAGLAAQDPQVEVLSGVSLGDEPYGMAIGKENPAFERFVNAVLDKERTDGTWQALYETWLCPHGAHTTCQAPSPPPATYRT